MKEKKVGFRVVRFFLVPLFKLCYRPKIINNNVIPKKGPVIFCGNHLHVWDQCPVICATNRQMHWMAKKEYFDSKLGPFFKMTGSICVDRDGDASASTMEALSYLEQGSAIGIFPEGTRNKTSDQELLSFKMGAVSMAKKSGATIVPFAVTGDFKVGSKNLMVRFGTPFKIDDMDLEKANNKLRNEILGLLRDNRKV